jgi:hypothetical protein
MVTDAQRTALEAMSFEPGSDRGTYYCLGADKAPALFVFWTEERRYLASGPAGQTARFDCPIAAAVWLKLLG